MAHWHLPYRSDEEPLDHPLFAHLSPIGIVDLLLFTHQQQVAFPLHAPPQSFWQAGASATVAHRLCACVGRKYRPRENGGDIGYFLAELLTTGHDFIRLETLRAGNDQITNSMATLPIFHYYDIEKETLHGSMDGQKFDTQIATINARHSPECFWLWERDYLLNAGCQPHPGERQDYRRP